VTFDLGAPTGGPPALSQPFAIESNGDPVATFYAVDAGGGNVGLYMLTSYSFIFSTPNETSVSASDDGITLTAQAGKEIQLTRGSDKIWLGGSGDKIELTYGTTTVSITSAGTTITTAGGTLTLASAGYLRLATATTAPVGTPTAGFYLWVDPGDNKLKARGPSGTTTDLASP
jgi:hypothetical protein